MIRNAPNIPDKIFHLFASDEICFCDTFNPIREVDSNVIGNNQLFNQMKTWFVISAL